MWSTTLAQIVLIKALLTSITEYMWSIKRVQITTKEQKYTAKLQQNRVQNQMLSLLLEYDMSTCVSTKLKNENKLLILDQNEYIKSTRLI